MMGAIIILSIVRPVPLIFNLAGLIIIPVSASVSQSLLSLDFLISWSLSLSFSFFRDEIEEIPCVKNICRFSSNKGMSGRMSLRQMRRQA